MMGFESVWLRFEIKVAEKKTAELYIMGEICIQFALGFQFHLAFGLYLLHHADFFSLFVQGKFHCRLP